MTLWVEQEARRRGLRDDTYIRYREAERQAAEAMRRVDERVAELGRQQVGRLGRWWEKK